MSSMHAFARDSSDESSGEENDFLHPSNDPNADEFADYNPRKRRRTGRDAKESAALGIFGSESEDEGPGKRWKGKSNLRAKGMAFVSTGQKTVDEDEEDDDEEDADDDVEMDDEEGDGEDDNTFGSSGGLGLGLGAPRGLGFQNPASVKPRAVAGNNTTRGGLGLGFGASKGMRFQSPAAKKSQNFADNRSTPLGKGFVPTSANAPILLNTEDEISTPRISRPSAFSTPVSSSERGGGKAQAAGPSMNAGSFAARMMAKMGYKEGQGLGKEGQGRSGVIEVQLRPQGVGLGAVREKSKQEKEEEKRQARLKGEVYEDSDEERKKKKAQKPKTSGTSSGLSTPRKSVKPKYRTVEELEKAAPGLKIPDAFAPILDMTGPGQRLLTSTSGLLTPTQPGSESVEQAENKKLARRAQSDLSSFVEEWTNLQQRKAYVDMQMIQQKQEIEETQPDLDQIKQFSDIVIGISEAVKDNQWDPVIRALISANGFQLSTDNETLSSIAVAAVHPFLRQYADGWQPLEDPKLNGMATSLFKIRHILGAETNDEISTYGGLSHNLSRIRIKSTTPYESMIYKIIFPKISSSINQTWNVHDPTPLLALLDAWEGLLPGFVRSQILDQAVIGKLNEAVSSWNPRKRRSHELPHLWLFPWLQYLPAHHADPKSSTGLVSDVKRKFRHLIDSWDFSKGVVPGLQQWREVLYPNQKNDHWTPLIMNHVLPRMSRFLKHNFAVEPQEQATKLPALQAIFAWKDILKPRVIGQVIIETVFPMWHDVLHQWLTETGPNGEIGEWFEWWRDEVFPEEIKTLKSIQQEFESGHEMINQALDLGSRAATDLPAPSRQTGRAEKVISPPPAPPTPARAAIPEEVNIRHKVEDWCIDNDIQFLPEKKVLHDAGPLYRITAAGNGKNGVLVYFKGEHLLALPKVGSEPLPIIWDNEEGRNALLGMAFLNVKQ